MANPSQFEDLRSGNQNNRDAQGPSSTLYGEENGQPSVMSITNTDVGTIATNSGEVDKMVNIIREVGPSIESKVTKVFFRESEDILASLTAWAKEADLSIVNAHGLVSHVEFLNRQGAPVPVHADFEIVKLEGNIVYPKKNGKNSGSWANVILNGANGLRGGPVKSLIAKSFVQVILSTVSNSTVQIKAAEYLVKGETFDALMNDMNNQNEVMNKIYEVTLKELNQL